MINLLRYIFLGHVHKFKIIKEIEVYREDDKSKWTRYYLQCEKCGMMKIFEPK
jgi:hypothetical protein